MKTSKSIVLSLQILTTASSAYKVDFYLGELCRGQPLSEWIGGKDQGCQQNSGQGAQSAVISSTGTVDDETFVQYYSSDNCEAGTETVGSAFSCIDIDGPVVGTFGSFQVVDNIEMPPLPASATFTDASLATATPVAKRASSHARRQPRTGLENTATHDLQIHHGHEAHLDGIVYRWHQIFDGAFVAVLPHEWDDDIHFPEYRSSNELLAAAGHVFESSMTESSLTHWAHIEERVVGQALKDNCKAVVACASHALNAIPIKNIIKNTPSALADFATARGKDFWEFITDRAFAIQVSASSLGGVVANGINGNQAVVIQATGEVSSNAMACSTSTATPATLLDQNRLAADMFKAYLDRIPVDQAVTMVVVVERDLGDETNSGFKIKMNVNPCGDPTNSYCGLQTGFCTVTTSQPLSKLF